jgi:hypothetical protein
MQIADQRWRTAIQESAFAPPDDGFADRLRDISAAARAEAAVLHEAATTPELRWNPIPTQPHQNDSATNCDPAETAPARAKCGTASTRL